DHAVLPEFAFAWRVGIHGLSRPQEAWLHLTIPPDRSRLTFLMSHLATRNDVFALLLTPSSRYWSAWPDQLRHRTVVAPLPDVTSAGEFTSRQPVTSLLRRLLVNDGAFDGEEDCVFRRDGDGWVARFEKKPVRLPDLMGCAYISLLLASPQMPRHASELIALL